MDRLHARTASNEGVPNRHAQALVLERRDLQEAVRIAIPIALTVTIASILLSGGPFPMLAAIGGPVVVALVGIWRLQKVRLRHQPHVLAFALLSVILAGRLAPLYLDLRPPYLHDAYFGFIVVAAALFLPWSVRWHAAWLIVAGCAYGFTLFLVPELSPYRPQSLAFAATAVLVSMAGNALVRTRRRRALSAELTLRRQRAALHQAEARLQVVAHQDSLTGLSNRRRLNEDVARVQARLARGLPGMGAVMVDLDSFKAYNDLVGHPEADKALRAAAAATRGAVRAVDHVYRYGGEEFLVLLEDDSAGVALTTAERIVRAVRDLRLPHPGTATGVLTASVGASASEGRLIGPWAVIDEADRALYEAKAAGRDGAVAYRVEPDTVRAGKTAAAAPPAVVVDETGRSALDPDSRASFTAGLVPARVTA